MSTRAALFMVHPKADLYQLVVEQLGVVLGAHPQQVRDVGHNAYYHRKVEETISICEGTRKLLADLCPKFCLHLVTSGHPETQQRKVELLSLAVHFHGIHYVHREAGMSKSSTFAEIMLGLDHEPAATLCVGDRPDNEILAGNQLGMVTVRICRGEFSHLQASGPEEQAHHQLSHILELPELLARLGC